MAFNPDSTNNVTVRRFYSVMSSLWTKIKNKIPAPSTTTPVVDGTATKGTDAGYARGDHVHPTDTSREAASNKKTTLNASSNTDFPTSMAVATFVNSSIATATANFLGTYDVVADLGLTTAATNAQIATALGSHTWPSGVSPTNNDYVFVSVDDPGTTTESAEYRRFKYNGSAWEYEYTLNNSSFTQAQWDAINSGVTASFVTNAVTGVKGSNESTYRTGQVNITKGNVGLGSVVNTGDSATPEVNGTKKFTTGGAYTELAKKAPNDHASTDTTYGVGNSSNYGHVKLYDSVANENTDGAPTQNAVHDALDLKADANKVVAIADAYTQRSSATEWFKMAECTYKNVSNNFTWNGTWLATLNATNSDNVPFGGISFFIRFAARFNTTANAPTTLSFTGMPLNSSMRKYLDTVKFKMTFDISNESAVLKLYYSPQATYRMLALKEIMGAIENPRRYKSYWSYTSYSSSDAGVTTEPVGAAANLNMTWEYSVPSSITLTSSDNLNNIVGVGVGTIAGYQWLSVSTPSNRPFSSENYSATMMVYQVETNYTIQVVYRTSKGIYQRRLVNGTWGAWDKILVSSDITTGSANGTISVAGSDVAVKGLGGAAYLNTGTASGTVATGNHTHTTSIASDSSSGTVVTLAQDTQYKLTAGGNSVLFRTPADSNTDTKVTQTVDTSNDAAYPILAKNTTATSTVTDTSRFTSGVTLNPKNKSITATTFIGALSGNATTATALSAGADRTKLDGIASGAEVNVQADWDETSSSADSFIKNKPQYEKYSDSNTIYYKVCSFSNVSSVGAEFVLRKNSGIVLYTLLNGRGTLTINAQKSGDVSANSYGAIFYYVKDSTTTTIYAKSNPYCRLFAAPLVNIRYDQISFSDFGTEVESLPEGNEAVPIVWMANSASSSNTAPVKVDAYGTLTSVPMDSTPTASSTNLITSGNIYNALNPVTPFDGYRELSFGSTVTFEDFCAGVTNTNSFAYKAFGASLDTTEKTIDAIFRLNLNSNTAIKTGIGNIADSYPLAHVVAIRQAGYVEFVSIGTGTVEQNRTIRFRFNRYGVLTICREIVTKNSSSATGSTSVPVYVNDKGVLNQCTDDFVHDGDVAQTYSSTSTTPISGKGVAVALAAKQPGRVIIAPTYSGGVWSNDFATVLEAIEDGKDVFLYTGNSEGNVDTYHMVPLTEVVKSSNNYMAFQFSRPRVWSSNSENGILDTWTCTATSPYWQFEGKNVYYAATAGEAFTAANASNYSSGGTIESTFSAINTALAGRALGKTITLASGNSLAVTIPWATRTGRSSMLVIVSGNNGVQSCVQVSWFKGANNSITNAKMNVLSYTNTGAGCVPMFYVQYGTQAYGACGIYLVLDNSSWATQVTVIPNMENVDSVAFGYVAKSTAQTATDLSSARVWSLQGAWDGTPTSGSTNAVTSGGIATALAGKQNTIYFTNPTGGTTSNPAADKTYVDDSVDTWVQSNQGVWEKYRSNGVYITGGSVTNDNYLLQRLIYASGTPKRVVVLLTSDKSFLLTPVLSSGTSYTAWTENVRITLTLINLTSSAMTITARCGGIFNSSASGTAGRAYGHIAVDGITKDTEGVPSSWPSGYHNDLAIGAVAANGSRTWEVWWRKTSASTYDSFSLNIVSIK